MVLEPGIFEYLKDDTTVLENALRDLSNNHQLMAYKHKGFWQCMDTLKEKIYLDKLIKEDKAPWMVWK